MIMTGETEVLGDKNFTACVVMEEWVWSSGGMIMTGENKGLVNNLPQRLFVHHNSHMD